MPSCNPCEQGGERLGVQIEARRVVGMTVPFSSGRTRDTHQRGRRAELRFSTSPSNSGGESGALWHYDITTDTSHLRRENLGAARWLGSARRHLATANHEQPAGVSALRATPTSPVWHANGRWMAAALVRLLNSSPSFVLVERAPIFAVSLGESRGRSNQRFDTVKVPTGGCGTTGHPRCGFGPCRCLHERFERCRDVVAGA